MDKQANTITDKQHKFITNMIRLTLYSTNSFHFKHPKTAMKMGHDILKEFLNGKLDTLSKHTASEYIDFNIDEFLTLSKQ